MKGNNYVFEKDVTELETVRQRWLGFLTGGDFEDYSLGDDDVKRYIEIIDIKACNQYAKLVGWENQNTNGRTYIFEDLGMSGDRTGTGDSAKDTSSQVTLTYDRLKLIAQVYATVGSKYYQDSVVLQKIIDALDIMYNNNHYSPGSYIDINLDTPAFWGNWYDWEIGIQLRYLDLIMFIYDDLKGMSSSVTNSETGAPYENRLIQFLDVSKMATDYSINRTFSGVLLTGANRVWKGSVLMELAVMLGDGDKITEVKGELNEVFWLVTTGDGFYADGSFIQHDFYSYTGGYGKAYIAIIAPLMYIMNDTEWKISYDDNAEKIFYQMVFDAYEPFIYNGVMMDMVRCREVARFNGQDFISGSQVLRAIIIISEVMEAADKIKAQEMIKYMISDDLTRTQVFTDPTEYFLEYYVSAFAMMVGKNILGDSSITPRNGLILHKTYASMDRILHLGKNYGFGIAMFSDRIHNFELTNQEPLRGWHLADGATYIYNGDRVKYSNGYWASVDHARLPGTTVERVPYGDSYSSNGVRPGTSSFVQGAGRKNTYGYAGGVNLGDYGIAAMQYQGLGLDNTVDPANDVRVNKSWFMFEDMIVALGSGITSGTGQLVETIVENYKIKDDNSNVLTINGDVVTDSAEASGTKNNVNYIHLEGNSVDGTSDTGYYFPTNPDIKVLRKQESKPWTVMCTYEKFRSDEIETHNYQTIWFNHGANPTDDTYQYVILPVKTEVETAEFARNPTIEIVENTTDAQSVKSDYLNILGINYIKDQIYTVSGITSSAQACIMVKETETEVEISISEPTQNKSSLTIDLNLDEWNFKIADIISQDDEISVSYPDTLTVRLTVDTTMRSGKSYHIAIEKGKAKNFV